MCVCVYVCMCILIYGFWLASRWWDPPILFHCIPDSSIPHTLAQTYRCSSKEPTRISLYLSSNKMAEELQDLASQSMASSQDGQPKAKRTKLKSYDQFSAQVFNPIGESNIVKVSLENTAKAMKAGNKVAPYLSELCSPMAKRKGIEISRLAEIQLLNGRKFKDDVYKKSINKSLYDEAMKEFVDLEPHFTTLVGKGLPMDDDDNPETVGKIADGGSSANPDYRTQEDVDKAVKVVYEWLQKPKSKFRALTALFAGGNIFYVAYVHEKCHRAYIEHGEDTKVTEESYASWARARLCRPTSIATAQSSFVNDLDGLS